MEESELSESVDSDRTTRPIRTEMVSEQSATEGDGHYLFNSEESQMTTDQPPDDLHVEIPLDDEATEANVKGLRPSLRQAPPAAYISKRGTRAIIPFISSSSAANRRRSASTCVSTTNGCNIT